MIEPEQPLRSARRSRLQRLPALQALGELDLDRCMPRRDRAGVGTRLAVGLRVGESCGERGLLGFQRINLSG